MSTVYAKQYGRLGNNLFQRAAAIGYAARYSIDYSFGHLYPKHVPAQIINEKGHNYNELPAPTENRVILDGYWQSEKYFAHCREEVLKVFGFNWMPPLPDTCAIHVRRGDYLLYRDKHPCVTNDYIVEAIQEISKRTNVKRFIFFSDDIGWCKVFAQFYLPQNLYCAHEWEFSQGLSDKEDLAFMASCQHQIIANSTFSWWGAWLNHNPDKVVISPSKYNWFGPGNAHLSTDDIIPDSWIQIKY